MTVLLPAIQILSLYSNVLQLKIKNYNTFIKCLKIAESIVKFVAISFSNHFK